jgi:hypothetical protein
MKKNEQIYTIGKILAMNKDRVYPPLQRDLDLDDPIYEYIRSVRTCCGKSGSYNRHAFAIICVLENADRFDLASYYDSLGIIT